MTLKFNFFKKKFLQINFSANENIWKSLNNYETGWKLVHINLDFPHEDLTNDYKVWFFH